MNNLAIYENAKAAIAQYKTVDEVKDFRDKAIAVEAYAKQANDYELEHDAALARVRAERKCGELLRDMEKAKGAQGNPGGQGAKIVRSNDTTAQPKTLSEMGVTKDQSSKWQKLAAIPEKEFEEAVTMPGAKPSTNTLIKNNEPEQQRMDKSALWLWGTLRDMRRLKIFDQSPDDLMGEWTDAMREDAEVLFFKLREWVKNVNQS